MHLLYGDRFKKRFNKLSPKVQKAFHERLRLYLENPKHPLLKGHPLHGNFVGLRAFSVTGDFRAIYKQGLDYLYFIDIGTHNQVY